VELLEQVGKMIGEDGLHSGCNGLYGPAGNLHRNAYCGRNFEYYSEDPCLISTVGAAECKGIQSKGIVVYEKHFAMNDSESHREGVGTWANEQTVREIYLEAFRGIMKVDGGNAHAAMSGFNRFGTTWTGDSNELMNNVLRGEWGFDGFVITDADSCNGGVLCTAYMYAPRAVTSGTDLYDGNNNHKRDTQLNAYSKDAYVVSCMRQAAQRILYVVANSAAMNGISVSSEIVEVMPWWQITLIGVTVGVGVLAAGSAALLVLNIQKNKKKA
jgi:beta-glucosidase